MDKTDDDEEGQATVASDKIDPFGENPGWDPMWVKAYKINFLGKVVKTKCKSKISLVYPRSSTWWCLVFSTLFSGVWL